MARHHRRQQNYYIQLLKMLQVLAGWKKLNPWVSHMTYFDPELYFELALKIYLSYTNLF